MTKGSLKALIDAKYADLALPKGISLDDSTSALFFAANQNVPIVDLNLVPQNDVISIGAKVVVESSYTGTDGLWDVIPSNNNSEVTLKVEKPNAEEEVSFELTNVPSDTTLGEHTKGVELAVDEDEGTATVIVPKTVGEHSLTLKSGERTQTITIHVIDVSLPNNSKIEFEDIQEEDVAKVSTVPEVIENMKDVYKTENKTNYVTVTHTYKGNVNNMLESVNENNVTGKYYWARIKIKDYSNISNLVATYVKDGKVVKLQLVPVDSEGAPNSVYVLLDANMPKTELVIAPNEAVDAQILNVASGNKVTVVFESTSKMQIQNFDSSSADGHNDDNINKIKTSQPDLTNANYRVVGADIDNMTEKYLDTENFTKGDEPGENKEFGPWACVRVKILKENPAVELVDTITLEDSDGLLLDTKHYNVDGGAHNNVRLWFKVEQEGTKKCTFVYKETNGYTERVTLTFDIKNSVTPQALKVYEGGDSNSKGIVVTETPKSTSPSSYRYEYEANVDTYKHGMDIKANPVDTQKDDARWYSIAIETQLPVESLVYADEESKWAELKPEMIKDGKIVIWINADDTDSAPQIILGNKWAVNVNGSITDGQNTKATIIKVKQAEKSKVALTTEIPATSTILPFGFNGLISNDDLSLYALTGINVEEKLHDGSGPQTLQNNIDVLKLFSRPTNISETLDSESDKYTVTLKLNTASFARLKLDSVEGKWILMHVGVRGNINTIKSSETDKDTYYVDAENAGKIVSMDGTDGKFTRLPIWINLTSDRVLEATSESENGRVTPLEIKFASSDPVEEENSFFLKIVDTNPNKEPVKVKAPSKVQSKKYDSDDDHTQLKQDFFWDDGGTVDFDAFLKNMKVMEQANIHVTDTVDNTVYVSVKANLKDLQQASGDDNGETTRFPLTFDVSPLGTTEGSNFVVAARYNNASNVRVSKNATQTGADDITMKINSKADGLNIASGKATAEFWFISAPDVNAQNQFNSVTDETSLYTALRDVKYIRYIVTFEQN